MSSSDKPKWWPISCTSTCAMMASSESWCLPISKRFWHLPGKDKEAARQKALQLFPDAHSMLARKGWQAGRRQR
jgi:hypothetical protein